MRSRRSLLVGSGSTAIAVLSAGCLSELDDSGGDDGGDSSSDPPYEGTDYPNGSNLDTIDGSDGADLSDSDTGGGSGGQSANYAERQEINDLYASGVGSHNNAAQTRNDAVKDYNNDRYSTAITKFELANRQWRGAEDDFAEAGGIALDIGHSEAREICETAEEYVSLMQLSVDANIRAVKADRDGYPAEQVNDNLDEVREHISEARRLNFRDPPVMERVLDLD